MPLIIIIALILSPLLSATIIPLPQKIEQTPGKLLIDVQTAVIADATLESHAKVLTLGLQNTTGFLHRWRTPRQVNRKKFNRAIYLHLKDHTEPEEPETYHLQITPTEATITAATPSALMHGVQTFIALMPVTGNPQQRALIPCQNIHDWPSTTRRIYHLDLSAHLYPTADLKTLIASLSFHKINELHLQFNGNNGWRLESPQHPKLHTIGSTRASTPLLKNPANSDHASYGGYYTHENLKKLIAHAQAHQLKIIPTFNFETGAAPIIAAYPELGESPTKVSSTWEQQNITLLNNETTHQFLDTLIVEVAALFPSSEIRLQGPANPALRPHLTAILTKHNRTLLSSEDLTTTNLSVYGRPEKTELQQSINLRSVSGFNPINQVYQTPSGAPAQATVTTEYIPSYQKLQYQTYPRIAAFAEATWSSKENKNYEEFRKRLTPLLERYRATGISTAKPYEKPSSKTIGNTLITTNLTSHPENPITSIYDGKKDTYFWSQTSLKKGDHITIAFPWPIQGDLSIATGRATATSESGNLLDGILETSTDGTNWDANAEFFDGLVSITVASGTRYARIRITGDQDESLIVNEITLSEPLLLPKQSETRQIEIPIIKQTIPLTFNSDITNHPQARDEVEVIRRTYYQEWYQIANSLGVATFKNTPHTFTVHGKDLPEMTEAQAKKWLLTRLIPALQNYKQNTPTWLQSGITSRLLGEAPPNPDPSQSLSGGPQTAAFLNWIAKTYSPELISALSQECHLGTYNKESWVRLTKLTLPELTQKYSQ